MFHDCLLVDSFFITRIPIPPSFKPLLAAPPPATQCKLRPSRSPGFDPQSGWLCLFGGRWRWAVAVAVAEAVAGLGARGSAGERG